MFQEYGEAVSLAAKERARAGKHMHRAYGLANFAREILLEAQPALARVRLRPRPAALTRMTAEGEREPRPYTDAMETASLRARIESHVRATT